MTPDPRSLYPDLPRRVDVIDCTLRDGEQTPGLWFTTEEKVELAKLLSAAGIAMLDAGFPAASGEDLEAMQEMRRLGLPVKLSATARPLPGDLAAAEKACADEVFMFMPTSELRLTQTLGVTPAQATELFRRGAEDAVGRGLGLNLVFEDATRADPALLVDMTLNVLQSVPVERLVICDTVGCAYPRAMERLIRTLRESLEDRVEMCTHCHNDFGLAVANTVAAVAAGASSVTCTVNGIGERAGNADLAETVASLTHLFGVEHGVEPTWLPRLSAIVERLSGIHTSVTKPVTGFNVYRHESGVHVDGMLKDSRSYEFLPADWVGRESEYVLGKHSGTALIRHLLGATGCRVEQHQAAKLLHAAKTTTCRRSKKEHERAYRETQLFRDRELSGLDFDQLLRELKDDG